MIKVLSDKYKLAETGVDYTLLLLGVGYGLNQKEIEAYLSLGENQLLKKHLQMVCVILGVEKSDVDVDIEADRDVKESGDIVSPQEQLIKVFRNYEQSEREDGNYERLAEYILQDKELSAAQIEQLRLAASARMPEHDVLVLAKQHRTPMEMKKYVEFFEMCKSS